MVAVDRMNLAIPPASFTSLLGPSGCGKTTTLRMIAGFEQPTEGEIFLAGRPIAGVPPYQRNVNTVFQHYALFPHMDVAQNVGYGLRQRKVAKAEEKRRVDEALDLVRLDGYGTRRTWEMSGGQQQRVALARALVNRPTVLLLDEPLGALDLKLRKEMQLELKALQQEVGITFVYVTHDQEEALTMSDMIVVMRDGRDPAAGRPEELYERPVNRFVAELHRRLEPDPRADRQRRRRPRGGPSIDSDARPAAASARSRHRDATPARRRRRRSSRSGPSACGSSPPRRPPTEAPAGTRSRARSSRAPISATRPNTGCDTAQAGEMIVRRQNAAGANNGPGLGPGDRVVISWREEANLVLTAEARPRRDRGRAGGTPSAA